VNGGKRVNEDATARRRQLGRLLRRAREAAGLTQMAVAEKLDCGQAKIAKIEKTLVGISMEELDKLIELYQVPSDGAAELRELAELDQREGPARTKHSNSMSAFGELTELEPEASEIRCWHSERIPGPLQSQMYNLGLYKSLLDDKKVDTTRVLREWTARSEIFSGPNPPRYRAILSESSFLRMPGGRNPQMVVDQSGYLLTLMDTYPHLEVQILTFDADLPYVDSDFQHLMFPDGQHCEFVYIEYPGGSRKCKNQAELTECRDHWEALSAAALPLAESREFLNRLAGRVESSAP
jgi:transcriptional regulator with XRE-family HTH domain